MQRLLGTPAIRDKSAELKQPSAGAKERDEATPDMTQNLIERTFHRAITKVEL